MHFTDTTELPYPCRQVYDMVADIERYPEFLPGWYEVRVLERRGDCLEVEQALQTGPAVFRFHSKAQLQPCSGIRITSNDGPFREMVIEWHFSEIDAVNCRVTVEMMLAMRPGLRNGALKLLLETGSSQLLPLFERRAHILYA